MQNNKFKPLVFALLLVCLGGAYTQLSAQGWAWSVWFSSDNSPYANDGNYVAATLALPDGRAFFVVNNSPGYYFYGGSDGLVGGGYTPNFNDNAYHFCRDAVRVTGDTIAVLEEVLPKDGSERKVFIRTYKLGPGYFQQVLRGIDIEMFKYPGQNAYARSLIINNNGEFVALGSVSESMTDDTRDLVIARATTTDGILLSSIRHQLPDSDLPVQITAMPDGNYGMTRTVRVPANPIVSQLWMSRLDPDGMFLGDNNISNFGWETATALTATADGNVVVAGRVDSSGDIFFIKFNLIAGILWRYDYHMPGQGASINGMVQDANGDLVGAGSLTDSTTMKTYAYLVKISDSGQPIWEKKVGKTAGDKHINDIALWPGGGYLLGGQSTFQALMILTNTDGIVYPAAVNGNVIHDFDLDCTASAGDLPLENWTVQVNSPTRSYFGKTDAFGNYHVDCDSGNLVVHLVTPNAYWGPCLNDVPVHIPYLDSTSVDFALNALINCPALTVEHASWRTRSCDTAYFTVNFCNDGTIAANDAYVDVTLDSLFTFLDSSIPADSLSENVLRFPVGTIGVGDCGTFGFSVFVSCDAQIGQTLCSEAHIYPDSICLPPSSNWSGAFLIAKAHCDGDSVRFLVKNVGVAPMSQALDYIVIEDAVLLRSGNYQLDAGKTMEVSILANGSTLHFQGQQEPGAPGNSVPLAAVEGCVGSSGATPSTGFFNQFAQNDADPFVSDYCTPVVNSFDPNDKQAFPTGYGAEHNIDDRTELEYMIRFQNTGNDIAKRIIIVDSLSKFLDPATFEPGASSHPYKLEMTGEGVLHFNFNGINLPYKNADERGSQGFITFRIKQKPNNPLGTVIANKAEIYFDFNLPIVTNYTTHTIHEPLFQIVSLVQPDRAPKIRFSAYPNPATDQVLVEIDGAVTGNSELVLYDLAGKPVRSGNFEQNRLVMPLVGVESGIYFFAVRVDGKLLGNGKLIVR
ncbi:MAG: T9SS type A sorting domain-containing protein [Bacteroidota bacterium]